MSDSNVEASSAVCTVTLRIHYQPHRRHDDWTWPTDKSPVLACEYQTPLPPMYQRHAKRLMHSLRQHTTDLDATTCRDCRRSEAFQRERRGREIRNNATPRGWHYWGSKRKRRQVRAEGSFCAQRYAAEQERLATIEAAKRPPVDMWRTRAARVEEHCPCPRHTKAHDKRVTTSLPSCDDD
jgi:hypothetical protein